jgi:hypothetical protein
MPDEFEISVLFFQENWSWLEIELTRAPPDFSKLNNPAGKTFILPAGSVLR